MRMCSICSSVTLRGAEQERIHIDAQQRLAFSVLFDRVFDVVFKRSVGALQLRVHSNRQNVFFVGLQDVSNIFERQESRRVQMISAR
jgi:hypothetical protein